MKNSDGKSQKLNDFFYHLISTVRNIEYEIGKEEAFQLKEILFKFIESQSFEINSYLLNNKNISTNQSLKLKSKITLKKFINNNVSFGTKEYWAQFEVIKKLYNLLTSPNEINANKSAVSVSLSDLFFDLNNDELKKLSINIEKKHVFKEEINKINQNDIILISHIFPSTWSTLVQSLQSSNKKVCWIGNKRISNSKNYGVLNHSEIPSNTSIVIDIFTLILHMQNTKRPIVVSGESFIGPNWNPIKVLALYCLINAFISSIKSSTKTNNLILILYDAIKPIASGANLGASLSLSYKKILLAADKIIYNSNTNLMTEFIENAIDKKTPSINYFRYPNLVPNKNFFFSDEIHIVCITVCLTEFDEPSRDNVKYFIKEILNQELHFHYYCNLNSNAVRRFVESLNDKQLEFFHLHSIIKDQNELINEISKYDFGLNPSDQQAIAGGISSIKDRIYMDAQEIFWQSTIATSFLVYAAAGLPVILPRGCVEAKKYLDPFAIPLNLSEYKNLRNVLKKYILKNMSILVKYDRSRFTNINISELIEFLEKDVEQM